MTLKRLNVNMDTRLIDRIDEYGKTLGLNRTATVSLLCSLQLKQDDTIDTMKQLIEINNQAEKK